MAATRLLSAAALVSTRWLEGKLTKHEMGKLGRACVAAMQAGIKLEDDSPFLKPMTCADNKNSASTNAEAENTPNESNSKGGI